MKTIIISMLVLAGLFSTGLAASINDAAFDGDLSKVRQLLDTGANIETRDDWEGTPLIYAAEAGHAEIIKLLLERGANIESRYITKRNRQTPLSLAAEKGFKEAVGVLLERGANIETLDENGETPLMKAAYKGHAEVVRLLLERGAKLETKDKKMKQTALLWAAYTNPNMEALALLSTGQDIDYNLSGKKEAARLLLDKGADVKARNKDGLTALALATRANAPNIVRLLNEHGAKK